MLLLRSGIKFLFFLLFATLACAQPNDIVLHDFATSDSDIEWFGPYQVDGEYWVADIKPENYSLVVAESVISDNEKLENVFLVHELSKMARKELKYLSIFSDLVSNVCWLIAKLFAFIYKIFIPWTFGVLKVLVLEIGGIFLPSDVIEVNTEVLGFVEFLAINEFDIFEGTFEVFAKSAQAEATLSKLHDTKDYATATEFLAISDDLIVSSFGILKQEQDQNVYQANSMATLFSDGSALLKAYRFPGSEQMQFDEEETKASVEKSNQFIMDTLDKIAEKSQGLSRLAPQKAKKSAEAAREVLNERN